LVRLDVDAGDVILDEERVGDLGRCIGAISHGFDDECLYLLCRERSLLVDIRKRESKLRDFSASTNPPILHRKELLLASSDRRRVSFAALTAELEARGLFADSHKIGLRRAWQERLDAAGVVIRDHRIIQERSVSTPHPRFGPAIRVERHRTAIARNRISSPMQMLARHGFLDSDAEVFDYGCGQGDDIRVLREAGVCARGWDPHFQPDQPKRSADIVNLGFVINVIEDPHERVQAMREAWSLCRKVMAIAVMAEGHYPVDGFRPFGDGFLTSRGTFQRFYSQQDLRGLVREALDVEPVPVAPGIVLVFREAEAEQEFLFRRRVRRLEEGPRFAPSPRIHVERTAEPISERLKPVLEQLWAKTIKLGREPKPTKFRTSSWSSPAQTCPSRAPCLGAGTFLMRLNLRNAPGDAAMT
jgi:hypothetical protein